MASIVWRKDREAWYAFYYDAAGKHHSQRIPNLSRAERRKAKAEAARIESEHGDVPAADLDIETAVAEYLESKGPGLSPETVTRYESVLSAFVLHLAPDDRRVRLRDIRFTHIEVWRNSRLADLHPNTVRNDLKDVRAFFTWALERAWVSENPAVRVKLPQKRYEQLTIPDFPTVNRIIEAARNESREFYALALLGGRGGLRRGDILKLEWINVDLANRVVYIVHGKSRTPRAIPLDDEMARFFAEHPREGDNPMVFPSPYDIAPKRRSVAITKKFNRWMRRFGPYTHKSLRHSFSDALRRGGASEAARALVLGHEDPKTTRIYSHPHVDELRPVVERLAALGSHPESPSPALPTPARSGGKAAPGGRTA
jgi:integrase